MDQQTPAQAADYLLCEDCEQMFRRNGEDWVLRHCYRGRGVFHIHTYLTQSRAVIDTGVTAAYEAARIQQIDTPALAYFAASVFWRGAVKNWHIRREILAATNLGADYQEQFRRFLIGNQIFPNRAVLVVIVSRNPEPLLAAMFPKPFRQNGYHHHLFHIPGIAFHMFVGQQIPAHFPRMCLVHSPDRLIYCSDIADRLAVRNMAELLPE